MDQLADQIRGRDLAVSPLAVEESSFELLPQPVQGANAIRFGHTACIAKAMSFAPVFPH